MATPEGLCTRCSATQTCSEHAMIPPEPRCPFCDIEVVVIQPRDVPQMVTRAYQQPFVRVTSQCPRCRLLFAEGEIARWRTAMEAE